MNASSTYVNFYLAGSNTYEDGDTEIKSVSTGKLRVGGSKTINLSYNLPAGQSASGQYIIAYIDQDNLIGDNDRNDKIIAYGPIQ